MSKAIAASYRIAHAAGWDAGNRSMRLAGRTAWSREDYRIAAKVCADLLRGVK